MSGENVADECVCDNGGFYLAYRAYNKLQNEDRTIVLPGFKNFTPKQMYWITSATSWCQKYNPNDPVEISDLANNEHPINHLRVYGGLQNFKEFSEDFFCAKGTNMNPEEKCAFYDMQ